MLWPLPWQTCPLDLHTDSFYEGRREAVEARVRLLRGASVETLHGLLAETWDAQQGRVCVLVNWERFSSLQQAQVPDPEPASRTPCVLPAPLRTPVYP